MTEQRYPVTAPLRLWALFLQAMRTPGCSIMGTFGTTPHAPRPIKVAFGEVAARNLHPDQASDNADLAQYLDPELRRGMIACVDARSYEDVPTHELFLQQINSQLGIGTLPSSLAGVGVNSLISGAGNGDFMLDTVSWEYPIVHPFGVSVLRRPSGAYESFTLRLRAEEYQAHFVFRLERIEGFPGIPLTEGATYCLSNPLPDFPLLFPLHANPDQVPLSTPPQQEAPQAESTPQAEPTPQAVFPQPVRYELGHSRNPVILHMPTVFYDAFVSSAGIPQGAWASVPPHEKNGMRWVHYVVGKDACVVTLFSGESVPSQAILEAVSNSNWGSCPEILGHLIAQSSLNEWKLRKSTTIRTSEGRREVHVKLVPTPMTILESNPRTKMTLLEKLPPAVLSLIATSPGATITRQIVVQTAGQLPPDGLRTEEEWKNWLSSVEAPWSLSGDFTGVFAHDPVMDQDPDGDDDGDDSEEVADEYTIPVTLSFSGTERGTVYFTRQVEGRATVNIPMEVIARGEDAIVDWIDYNVDPSDIEHYDTHDTDYEDETVNESDWDTSDATLRRIDRNPSPGGTLQYLVDYAENQYPIYMRNHS